MTVADGAPEEGGEEEGAGGAEGEGGDEEGEGVAGVVVPPIVGGGAVPLTEVPGASAPYARPCPYPRGAAYKVHVQANTQVSAGPRARARALRSAGVTG
ncbi:hypothetical protein [Streptomyces sp. NPDC058664]|uniref:hypothetical protein n=1 Tax=unclassified Streptomyces TaxID=2593676 RepID=UPI0036573692